MVETAGVEPASESPVLQTSTYLDCCSCELSEAQQTKLLKSQPDEFSPLSLRREQKLSHHDRRDWLSLMGRTQSARVAYKLGSHCIRIIVCVYIFFPGFLTRFRETRYAVCNPSTPVEAHFRPHTSKEFDES